MKVLLLNLGYCSGLDGSMHDYLLHGARYLHTPGRIAQAVEKAVLQLIKAEAPDICCFLELHKKSVLVKDLRDFPCQEVDNKYGAWNPLRRLPFFRDNCNGFFSRGDIPHKKYFFKKGTKKLIYELKIGDVSLLLCHFPLSLAARREQFDEVKAIVADRKRVILCGDFNIFHGTGEIESLMAACRMRAVNPCEPTFPAFHPTKTFDLFLCTEDINVTHCQVVRDFHGSDHLPVLLEFQV